MLITSSIIMQGTSPFAYQSPSFHSSSYLPKLEANFMRDFSCCGLTLPTLHDLMQHYEEHHHQQMQEIQRQNSNDGPTPDPKAAIAAGAAAAIREPGQAQSQQAKPKNDTATPQRSKTPVESQKIPQQVHQTQRSFASIPTPQSQDDDAVGDMEMDDDYPGTTEALGQQFQVQPEQPSFLQRSHFGQPGSSRVPPLNLNTLNMGNPLQQHHQGLRNSTPTTPVSAGRSGNLYQNNPTVSSVNTPTLSTYQNPHPLQQQYSTPQSSAPGTPGELDGEFVGQIENMNMGNNLNFLEDPRTAFNGYAFNDVPDFDTSRGFPNSMVDFCIDEPARRLTHAQGALNPVQPAPTSSASQLGDGQYSENSELAKTIREQQKLAGVPDPSADGGVPKPFHCPVIGCEKAYKNHNGLKYHKAVSQTIPSSTWFHTNRPPPLQHGHNTQTLSSNANGTFSVVDPETLQAYPGTLGMEKLKPYRCETCGKRYKNLNGLKYHKNHSPICDPEIRTPTTPTTPTQARTSLGGGERGRDEMVM